MKKYSREEKIAALEAALKQPEGKYSHDFLRQKLANIKASEGHSKGSFIDRVDGGIASVQDAKGEPASIPAERGMAEGGYVGGSPAPGMPTAKDISAHRARLGAGDPGGPIVLGDDESPEPMSGGGPPRPPPGPPPMSELRSSELPMDPRPNELPEPEARPGYFLSMGREYPDNTLGKAHSYFDTAGMAANRAVDVMTLGNWSQGLHGWSDALGTQIGPSREDYANFQKDSPITEGLTTFGANLLPQSAGSKLVGGARTVLAPVISKGVDPLTRVVAKRAPAVATALEKGKDMAISAGSAALGNVMGTGIEDTIRGYSDEEIQNRMMESGKTGALFGAGLHGLFKGAGAVERFIGKRSPRIKELGKYNLEPGPIPMRPVIEKDKPLIKQLPGLSEPALGVTHASPSTRAEAGRAAVETLAPDIRSVREVSNEKMGQMEAAAYRTQGQRPGTETPVTELIDRIERQLRNESLPDTTVTALGRLRARIMGEPIPPNPEDIATFDNLLDNRTLSPRDRRFLQAERARAAEPTYRQSVTPRQLNEIRDYADDLGRQEAAVGAKDVPLRQESDYMRDRVANVAPHIAMVNKYQNRTLKGIEEREALLDLPASTPRGPKAHKKVMKKSTKAVRQSGEDSATAGAGNLNKETEMQRLGTMGRPPVYPGVEGENIPPMQQRLSRERLAPDPGYQSSVAPARLQLHQEGLQALPSQMFSAGNRMGSLLSMPQRLAGLLPERVVYPLARRLGARTVGSGPFAVDALSHAINRAMENYREKAEKEAVKKELDIQEDEQMARERARQAQQAQE